MTEKILIVQSGFLGDAVLASGMLRALEAARPEIEIGLVVRSEAAPLFEGHPALTTLYPFDKKRKGATQEMIEKIAGAGYGTALLAHRSFRSAWIARRAKIVRRIGFRQSEGAWQLTDRIEYMIAQHETERNGALIERAGIATTAATRRPWLVPDPAHVVSMRERFAGEEKIIVIAPGSVWDTKQWTVEGFADTARELHRRGAGVVLAGSPADRPRCEAIAREAGLDDRSVTAGDLSLPELLALIAISERVIANDSAPVHLAESVGTPVTTIFGPTVPEFGFGPLGAGSFVVERGGLTCRPCRIHGSRRCPIGTHECMTAIPASEVLVHIEL